MGRKQITKDFEELYTGQNIEKILKNYYLKKKKDMILILIGGVLFLILALFYEFQESKLTEGNIILRNENGKGTKDVQLEVKSGNGEWQNFDIEISDKEYQTQELEEAYLNIKENLQQLILEENTSLNHVTSNLNLIQEIEGEPFLLVWKSYNPEVIDSLGNITKNQIPKEGIEVNLEVLFKYEEWQKEEIIKIKIFPNVESERLYYLKQYLVEQENKSRNELKFKLPDYFKDEKLEWRYVRSGSGRILGFILLILLPFIYYQKDKEIHRMVQIRRKELSAEYPEFITKLILYMEAGMNINGALFRIAEDYQMKRKNGTNKSYLYEEVLYVCKQYRNGLSEKESYALLGKRCNLPCYKKLTGLLIQYLQKGGIGILENLRMEVTYANEERKKQIKKQGEEMGTKLLIPMILMLGIVMVLIMVPACFSFQM